MTMLVPIVDGKPNRTRNWSVWPSWVGPWVGSVPKNRVESTPPKRSEFTPSGMLIPATGVPAAALVEAGAAMRIADEELTPQTLVAALDRLSSERLATMAHASAALGMPGAAERVLAVLHEVAKK